MRICARRHEIDVVVVASAKAQTCAHAWQSVQNVQNYPVATTNYMKQHGRIQRGGGGRGSGPPLKNHKNIGFLSNAGPDSLKNLKSIKPAFNFVHSSARQ